MWCLNDNGLFSDQISFGVILAGSITIGQHLGASDSASAKTAAHVALSVTGGIYIYIYIYTDLFIYLFKINNISYTYTYTCGLHGRHTSNWPTIFHLLARDVLLKITNFACLCHFTFSTYCSSQWKVALYIYIYANSIWYFSTIYVFVVLTPLLGSTIRNGRDDFWDRKLSVP